MASHAERVLVVGAAVILVVSWSLYLWLTSVLGFDTTVFETQLASTLVLIAGVVIVILAARFLKSRRTSATEPASASVGQVP